MLLAKYQTPIPLTLYFVSYYLLLNFLNFIKKINLIFLNF